MKLDLSRIAQDLQIRKVQVESVVQLLDEGNTVPFITRYRKERTSGLNEQVIRTIQTRVAALRQLAERKQTILKSIDNQGKLSDELCHAILAADTPKRLEDLYLPYKPKKATLASKARERGLEPLAFALWNREPAVANLHEVLPTLINPEKELHTPEEVLTGAQHILAELISETADVRAAVRSVLWETGKLCTVKHEKLAPDQGLEYKDYFQFTEAARTIPPHRILAINRGEKENALQVKLEWDVEGVRRRALDKLPVPQTAPPPEAPSPPADHEAHHPDHEAPGRHRPEGGHRSGPRGPAPLHDPLQGHPHEDFLRIVLDDALSRLLLPSLEREIRRELTNVAEEHAVGVFARNLRNLLLQPPLHGRRVLAIDPGFRTGCKVACLDENGNLLEDAVVYPHPPQNKKDEARAKLEELVRKHQLNVVSIGNGTACRETEELVSELIARLESPPPPANVAPPPPPVAENAAPTAPPAAPATATPAEAPSPAEAAVQPPAEVPAAPAPPPLPVEAAAPAPSPLPATPYPDLAYVIVNEAGASVYSASNIGREEFPNFDATLRGTISIGRRLQDPLSEWVKVDPQNIGVGLYQHDVSPRQLKDSLDAVIESCVNHVGVDLNTASVPLLRHVSGLNQLTARELVEYRKQHGPFQAREQLMQVPGIGETRFTQAAGFLKIAGSNPLDRTWIHPESYALARQLLAELGYVPENLDDKEKLAELREKLKTYSADEAAARLDAGSPTVRDVIEALMRPGRDPREDLPPPIFKKKILKLEDLLPGMELKGMVLNVVPFGAFVDIGLKDSGLVHISQMANRYVKSPDDVVAVGDVVTVWVLSVDQERRRVSLTMIQPGTERKPPEKKPQPQQTQGERPPQRERGAHPPQRGRRPGGPPQRGRAPAQAHAGQGGGQAAPAAPASAGSGGNREGPPQRGGHQPPQRPRRPGRPTPKPKLTQSALEGKTPLRTFAELAAFAAAQRAEEAAAAAAAAAAAPTAPPAATVEEAPKE